ncbi:MAG: DUF2184 domain-containing protein [Candidatus Hydrogenedentes bacterium]|nr:DUF2184 domain-containing protein [Candidatus Hydrogenedentota bacterium]
MPPPNIAQMELARHLDAGETVFLERELTFVMARVIQKDYPQLEAMLILPIDRSASPADRTILWREFDATGLAKIVANYASDLPRVDVFGEEHNVPIRSLGASYGFSVQDVREAAKTGRSLEQRKATAARTAIEQLKNRIGFNGDSTHGLLGLFTTPNTNDVTAGTASASPNGTAWSSASGKTPDEILEDLTNLQDSVRNATNGVHRATHLVIPANSFAFIKNTPRASGSDKSILTWFKDQNPGIEIMDAFSFQVVTNLPSGASGSDSVAMAYVKDPDLLAFAIPMAFTQHPPESRNLEFIVNVEERVGGLIVWKPLTISFMEGV